MNKKRLDGPWLMYLNPVTGRTEVYEERQNKEVLVGSMPGNPTEADILEMMRRLSTETPC